MRKGHAAGIEWRDAKAYAMLRTADRSFFAWEWLRRDRAYREAVGRSATSGRFGVDRDAFAFGLVAFEDPGRGPPEACPLWSSAACPFVLEVDRAESASAPEDLFDLGRFRGLATLISGEREHLLLSDGLRAIRLDGAPGTFTGGPATLCYRIAGLQRAAQPLLTLRRLLALARSGRFSRTLHPPEARARRWVLQIRAWDALAAGASQQEIARELLCTSLGGPGWRVREPSFRSRAQRLVRSARLLAAGGYREFLGS